MGSRPDAILEIHLAVASPNGQVGFAEGIPQERAEDDLRVEFIHGRGGLEQIPAVAQAFGLDDLGAIPLQVGLPDGQVEPSGCVDPDIAGVVGEPVRPEQMITLQSLQGIDAVTGASTTSEAVLNAATDALSVGGRAGRPNNDRIAGLWGYLKRLALNNDVYGTIEPPHRAFSELRQHPETALSQAYKTSTN